MCRRIYTMYKDCKKQETYRYAFVHFSIEDGYVPLLIPHKNSTKNKKGYTMTKTSTLSSLKRACETKRPKEALAKVRKESQHQKSLSGHPRNYNQAANARTIQKKGFKSLGNPCDELIQAIYMCKKPGDNFVREVQSAPEGIAVLASDTQLKDVARFCSIPPREKAAVFCVDLTFNLGDFFLTVTSYKNMMLVKSDGNHPVHIGPVQIQHRKLLSSYSFFASCLKRIEPEICGLKIFGTDEEKNIINAFEEEFYNAVNLQCFRHYRQNIERRLSGWGANDKSKVFLSFRILNSRSQFFHLVPFLKSALVMISY